jgi:hypothetical protein
MTLLTLRQLETAAHLNRIRAETLSKTRIPIDLVLSVRHAEGGEKQGAYCRPHQ